MKTNTLFGLIILLSGLILISSDSYANEQGIEVTGMAKINVAPDMATFSFSVSDRGKEIDKLKREIDKKTSTVIALCKKLGIETKNISSTQISIHPRYNYKTESFIGYDVSRNVKVILNDLDKYTDLVNGAIESGITTISSIKLDVKNRAALERKGLASALAAAKKKARVLAKAEDVSLGKLISVKETGGPIGVNRMRLEMATSDSMRQKGAFEPGEITITTSVVARYAIK